MPDTPDLNQITNLTNTQGVAGSQLIKNQGESEADFLKRYNATISGQEGSQAMATRIGNELGIPSLQANATLYRNTLTNLPSTYSKATTGYDVNANQLSRIIGQKSSELSPLVATTENSLAGAQNTLGQRMGYELTDQSKALLPFQTEQDLMKDRFARETSMFSVQSQNELNSLIAKINAGITLSEGEKNRANALAVAENNYQNSLKLQNSKPAEADGTQIVEVGGQKYLINSRTGAIVSKYGAATPEKTPTDYLLPPTSNPPSYFRALS